MEIKKTIWYTSSTSPNSSWLSSFPRPRPLGLPTFGRLNRQDIPADRVQRVLLEPPWLPILRHSGELVDDRPAGPPLCVRSLVRHRWLADARRVLVEVMGHLVVLRHDVEDRHYFLRIASRRPKNAMI